MIGFLERAFGAKETERHTSPDGVILHMKLEVGDAVLEMGEAHGPYQPMPSTFLLYVADTDDAYRRTLHAGATTTLEPADQPYGHRLAEVKDPFGNVWYIATPIQHPAS